jgi:hypothetical protein
MRMMLELLLPRENLKILVWKLAEECNLFDNTFRLPKAPYAARVLVSVDSFRQFVLVLEDKDVEVTNVNIDSLARLCDQFGF